MTGTCTVPRRREPKKGITTSALSRPVSSAAGDDSPRNHCANLRRVVNIDEWIRIEQNDVGSFSGGDGAEITLTHECCGIGGCRAQRAGGREARFDQQGKLFVQR